MLVQLPINLRGFHPETCQAIQLLKESRTRTRLQLVKVKAESTCPQHEQQDVFAIMGGQLHPLLGSIPHAEKRKAAKGCHQQEHAFCSH